MLLTARHLDKWYGPRQLFSGLTLGISEGERVGLIGANGTGKSTLLRVFAGVEGPDGGELIAMRQLRVGFVPQEIEFGAGLNCREVVVREMGEGLDEHEKEMRAEQALSRAGFLDYLQAASTLSGGWRKRLAIVGQVAKEPHLLLMDEPTNHLDLEGIAWVEKLVAGARFSTLTVTHDRRFLEVAANRIVELGGAYPDGFLSIEGNYSAFLEKREEFLAAQAGRERALASTVRREIEWLQRGAKARTTKAKGRIERAGEMKSELAELGIRNSVGAAGGPEVSFSASDRKTRKLMELKKVGKSLGGKRLFSGLDLVLSPGKRMGLIGPNGSGKSTLIRLLNGEMEPDVGTIFRAENLKVVTFDQHREQLDQEQTLRRSLNPSGDTVKFGGNSQHITGWAKRFLFRTEQLDLPVGSLSGGEQARVLIARLMLREADVLILDEPTNDLDIPTLDVLEESLASFPGALLLVTHDRYLMDRVSTELLALDGKGNAKFYADLDQWERGAAREKEETAAKAKGEVARTAGGSSGKKMRWSDQRELEGMEAAIGAAELLVAEFEGKVADPNIMGDRNKMHEACEGLGVAQREVERLYHRWAELEALR